jgi:hypothetical protein
MRLEIIALLEQLGQNDPSLKELNLSHKNLDKEESIAILKALQKNTVVTELNYFDNNSTGNIAHILGETLKFNSSIKNLYLGFNHLNNEDLTHIVEGLQHNNSVIMLDLNSNLFDNPKPIANLLESSTSLEKIELTDSLLNEEGFRSILEALKNNKFSALIEFSVYYPQLNCLNEFTELCQLNKNKIISPLKKLLTDKEKDILLGKLYSAIQEEQPNQIIQLLKEVDPEDQVWILNHKLSFPINIPITLSFSACVRATDETFLALVQNLPHSKYIEVFSVLIDGNTTLSEALSWGRTARVKTLLTQVNEETFKALLNTKNSEGLSLEQLLSQKTNQSGFKNLLEEIKFIREKSFSAATAAARFGLHAAPNPSANKESSTSYSSQFQI